MLPICSAVGERPFLSRKRSSQCSVADLDRSGIDGCQLAAGRHAGVTQAFDVAAYVNGHPRPDFPDKIHDWPNGDAPPDVAYPTQAARRKTSP